MPDSKAQVRWAHAVVEGTIQGDKDFAKEVVGGMHGRKMSSLPERAGKPGKGHMFGRKKKKAE